jgi:hypothetical protein
MKPLVPESPSCGGTRTVPTVRTVLCQFKKNTCVATYQIGPESFHDLPDVPILQSLSDLRVVVDRSAANLLGGQRSGGGAHGVVSVVWWWFEFEFELSQLSQSTTMLVMCSDYRFKLY